MNPRSSLLKRFYPVKGEGLYSFRVKSLCFRKRGHLIPDYYFITSYRVEQGTNLTALQYARKSRGGIEAIRHAVRHKHVTWQKRNLK